MRTVASCWANSSRTPAVRSRYSHVVVATGRLWLGPVVAFYFCINSNKHDNEMTTEMSDYIPHNPPHTHTNRDNTQIIMQYYFIPKRWLAGGGWAGQERRVCYSFC